MSINDQAIDAKTASLEHVLLVDDNPVNLQILHKTLHHSGYQLSMAKNGQSAIEMATSLSPSLILLDIVMPDMDGYQVCKILKENPATASIAVIFLSSLEDIKAKVKGFEVGGVDYISKPFQTEEILARVSAHIKINHLEQQLAQRNVELESENRQILNAVSEGIIGLDIDSKITFLNPAATEMCGWGAEDCLGHPVAAIALFDIENQASPEFLAGYESGQSVSSDMELIRCRDGSFLPVAIAVTPKGTAGAVMVLRDISSRVKSEDALRNAREQLEQQRQNIAHIERLNSTGEMAAGIAHEVNQPLTAIANYSRVAIRLLQQDAIDRVALGDLMEKMSIQSDRASRVIQRIRSFVIKPGAGLQVADINALIRDVITLAEVDSRMNDVVVQFEPGNDLPLVNIDIVQVQQVSLNLIRNAMQASNMVANQQPQDVVVKTGQQGRFVTVEVIDQGVGVEPDAEKKLFSTFYTTKVGGMGIGLSICRSIVDSLGGKIAFRRNPQGGSIFYFTLPVK